MNKLTKDNRLDNLYSEIANVIRSARSNVKRAIDLEQVKAYWLIGYSIVEEEQAGADRAEYGKKLLKNLSDRLTKEFGKGFSARTLLDVRKFYLVYQESVDDSISHAPRAKSQVPQFRDNLGWTHYRSLMRITRPEERKFYEVEASKNNWSSRELDRQLGSLLFDRLAKSKDKKGLMDLVINGQEIATPEDVFKEPLVLEFLNMPESPKLLESDLEEALISNLQNFLLELGRGFAFVARQKRLTLDGKHFFCDLVFYHTILKCYVLVDIKVDELTHGDLGQMQLYKNYYDAHCLHSGDNPTIGLILCTEKSDVVVEYFLGDKEKNIFAKKYQLYLPSKAELEAEIKKEVEELKSKFEYEKE
ncbi:MAG: DUF1016 family protein [Gammaproteobacteria bacterium]|nr:DUF1016 family protein [Gammaproteobacteria bacterium]